MGMVGEAQRHAESVEVLLQESVSVSRRVKARHCALELLQPRAEILLVLPATGQVGLHHLPHQEVVARICTLRQESETTDRVGASRQIDPLMGDTSDA